MSKLRNPFKMRASEKIDSDANFLRLFSPLALDSLVEKYEQSNLWDTVLYIRSSPGAGKTTLLRVFEPECLKILVNAKNSNIYKEIFSILEKIEVLSQKKPRLLATIVQCNRSFELLEELNINEVQKKRLFFSLLNVRIIISTLRNSCALLNLRFPEELHKIEISNFSEKITYNSSDLEINNGRELFDWASKIETKIFKKIDSFLPSNDFIEGNDEILSLEALSPESLKFENKSYCDRILFVLDDAHKLSSNQRIFLKSFLNEKRGKFSIWVSERLEALEPNENIGSFPNRDYDEINIETFWRENYGRFEKVLRNIALKRAEISSEDVTSFEEYLTGNLNESKYEEKLQKFIEKKQDMLKNVSSTTAKYDEWIDSVINYKGNSLETAQYIAKTEILINRGLRKSQLSFDFPLTVEELNSKLNDVTAPAHLFLSKDAGLPYYFGFSTVSKASSFNIEQFISFCSELYEKMISKKIKGNSVTLNEQEQEDILKIVAKKKWESLRSIVPYPKEIMTFLKNLGDFCYEQTYQNNAPYGAGVTGFAIQNQKNDSLFGNVHWMEDEAYESFMNILSTCISFNLLEPTNISQGQKGDVSTVYYMNRWLCIYFNLPLGYGGWRHRKINDLNKMMKK